jgi:hypothetical protein
MLQLEQNNNEKIKQEKKEAEKQLNEMIQMLSKLEVRDIINIYYTV